MSKAIHIVLNMSRDNGRYVGSPAAESVSVNPRHGDTSLAASPNIPQSNGCTRRNFENPMPAQHVPLEHHVSIISRENRSSIHQTNEPRHQVQPIHGKLVPGLADRLPRPFYGTGIKCEPSKSHPLSFKISCSRHPFM